MAAAAAAAGRPIAAAAASDGVDSVESSPTPLVFRLTVMLIPTAVTPTDLVEDGVNKGSRKGQYPSNLKNCIGVSIANSRRQHAHAVNKQKIET